MSTKLLINALDAEECRIAKVKDSKLEEFFIESASREIIQGNIYKGVISRIVPSLQAVFVDFGAERNGFLQKHEIHSDYFQDMDTGDHGISNLIKSGQELLVQVTKDPSAQKGAMLTTFISLPGRYIVLMPGSKTQGISRKIEDEGERNRIKELLNSLKIPEGFGLIVRTVGSDCTKTILGRDLGYLLRLWKNIKKMGITQKAPALLYKERNLVIRSIRDHLTPDIKEILVDDESVYHEVKEFVKMISSRHADIVKLHKDPEPVFTKHQLEDQIASIFESRVELKSGGSIVIDQTEALVAIDVNSGKATQKKSIEQTALQTNLEAAEEIARQLHLRDLGGLIVIDFIDMKDQKHRVELERVLKSQLKSDKARTSIGKISKFGLMEMSRQRIHPSIESTSYEPCKYCRGKGLTPSVETLALRFLRKLQLDTLREKKPVVKATLPTEVAAYLLNKKRKELLELETRRECSILIEAQSSMAPGESELIFESIKTG
ncbi:MAG: ribonuclease [Deltaproteobacteria bacterium RBG_13_49_15]|nr:MAG: ribonuclease [Deltaproteobacteria bacterium RBG_13_49_15]